MVGMLLHEERPCAESPKHTLRGPRPRGCGPCGISGREPYHLCVASPTNRLRRDPVLLRPLGRPPWSRSPGKTSPSLSTPCGVATLHRAFDRDAFAIDSESLAIVPRKPITLEGHRISRGNIRHFRHTPTSRPSSGDGKDSPANNELHSRRPEGSGRRLCAPYSKAALDCLRVV